MNKIGLELWDFFKKNFAILLIGVLFLLFYFRGCKPSEANPKDTHDTTTVTSQVPQPIIIMPPYQPQQAGQTVYVPLPQSSQGVIPASTMDGLILQVKDLNSRIENLGRDYYAIRRYSDSIQLKDTAGNRVGVVKLDQVVSENILKETRPTYQLSFPHTVTTITNTIYPKPKNQWSVGVGVESMMNKPINQVDLGLMIKNKKDNLVGISGTYDISSKSPGFRVAYYQKISFK